jgi:hypothetical protein
MHGLKAVLAGCGHMADEVEWPLERLTNQQNPSVPSVSSVRDLPILRFTAAPELVANRVLREIPDSPLALNSETGDISGCG